MITGASVSVTLTVKLHVVTLLQSSVAVYVTVVNPNGYCPLALFVPVKLFTKVTVPQASLMAGMAMVTVAKDCPASAVKLMFVGQVKAGAVLSSMVKVALVVVAFPQASVAVKITVAAPVAPQRSLNAVKLLVQVITPQLSVAVAPPLEAIHAFKAAVLPRPSHSTVWLAAASVITGAVLS